MVKYESDFHESDVEIVLRGEEGAELSESEGDDDSELDNSAPSGERKTGEVESSSNKLHVLKIISLAFFKMIYQYFYIHML